MAMPNSNAVALLTPAEMSKADAAAVKAGVSSLTLMENAGSAVAGEIIRRWPRRPVTVLCGPGNNGGDGYVAARQLRERGWPVRILSAGSGAPRRGDALASAERWGEPVAAASPDLLHAGGLVVDALLGAGLARDLDGEMTALVAAVNASDSTVIAVDVPTGIDGATGAVRGAAMVASLTVSFVRKKPGHLLLPGRQHCGELVVADIGVPDSAVEAAGSRLFENGSTLWKLPRRGDGAHKYDCGHAVVVSGGPWNTGAARLAAVAALRAGAGLVTVAASRAALPVHAAHLTSVMLKEIEGASALAKLLEDRRINVVVLGPGAGIGAETRLTSLAALASGASVVLDADALTSFADDPQELFAAIAQLPGRPVTMTPHEGEFARLFGTAPSAIESKVDRARWAAALAGATVVLKGADTIVAAPAGLAVLNANAPPELATAGSGDVLAGLLAGLMAQKMPPLEAAAAAAWIHGEAGNRLGPGLIAEDLPTTVPAVLKALR